MHKPRPMLFLLTQCDWQLMLRPAARKPSRPSRTSSQSTSIRCHCIGVVSRRRFSWTCHLSSRWWSIGHWRTLVVIRPSSTNATLKREICWNKSWKETQNETRTSTALGIWHSVFSIEIFHAHLHLWPHKEWVWFQLLWCKEPHSMVQNLVRRCTVLVLQVWMCYKRFKRCRDMLCRG